MILFSAQWDIQRTDLSTETCIRIAIPRNDPSRPFRVRFQLREWSCQTYLVNLPLQKHDDMLDLSDWVLTELILLIDFAREILL